MITRLLLVPLTVIFVAGAIGADTPSNAQPVKTAVEQSKKPAFATGQVWDYKTREQDKGSTFTVIKVEDIHGNKVVHLRVDGLHLKNPAQVGGYANAVGHLPIAETAVSQSAVKMVRTGGVIPPESIQGYETWHKVFDAGHAHVFNLPVADVVQYVEAALAKQKNHN